MIECEHLSGSRCGLADAIAAQFTDKPARETCEKACAACQSRHPQTPTMDSPGTVVASFATQCGHHDAVVAMRPHLLNVSPPKLVQLKTPRQTRATAETLPCIHRGAVTRQQESDLCGSRGEFFDVFACGLHGECAIGRVCQRQTVRACSGCADRREPSLAAEIPDDVTRHMLYHVWPNRSNNGWRWNVAQLLQRIHLFDGVRSVGVVTDDSTDTLADVQAAFDGERIDNWIHLPNNKDRREGVTFLPMMATIPTDSGVTWYGHAKGVRHDQPKLTRLWAESLYRLTLDDWPNLLESLRSHPITGAFKRTNEFKNLPKHHCWHYSGTFYWFRNADVFARPGWNDLAPKWFCVEAWPARIFAPHEGGCLFGDDAGNLYEQKEWDRWQPILNARLSTSGSSASR